RRRASAASRPRRGTPRSSAPVGPTPAMIDRRYDDPAPILRRLEAATDTLELLYNILSPARVAALAADARLRRVRTLVLHDNRLGDAGLATLVASPHLAAERVAIRRNGIGAEGVRALAAWPRLASVRSLDLAENPLRPPAIEAPVASPHLGALRVLGLAQVGGGLDALLQLPVLTQLSELDLAGTEETDLAIALRGVLGPRLKL